MASPSHGAPSKKEQVLQLAQQDPFLRIEEIARRVGTTPPYVRTILSEGRISLGRLRKSYARDMERRLKGGQDRALGRRPAYSLDAFHDRITPLGPLHFGEVDSDQAMRLVREWDLGGSPPFVCAFRNQQTDDGVECLHRVITNRELTVGPGGSDTERSLGGYLRLEPDDQVGCSRTTIEIEPADAVVSQALRLSMAAAVFCVRRGLIVDGEVVALEEFVFRVDEIRLIVGHDSLDIEPRAPVGEDLASGGS